MEWTEEMIRQCGNPTGEIGRIVAREMNESHYGLWEWGLSHIDLAGITTILDVGCGGGGGIKMLAAMNPACKIHGIDISNDMVSLSREVNADLIRAGTLEIRNGSVTDIPYPGDTFDLVTSFETDYFWSDIKKGLREILRVLKPEGTFIIVDEAYVHELYEERNNEWAELLGVRFYAPEEYRRFLSDTGFISTDIIEIPERNWITIISRKPL